MLKFQITHLTALAILCALLTGCPCGGPGTPATLTPLDDPPGYAIEGEWGFTGTLTKTSDSAPWLLEGLFVFPSSGYDLTQTEVQIAESFPEQVTIRFNVKTPRPNAIVLPVLVETPVSFEIDVNEAASFDIHFVQACY